jgi:hypothetical protein
MSYSFIRYTVYLQFDPPWDRDKTPNQIQSYNHAESILGHERFPVSLYIVYHCNILQKGKQVNIRVPG